MAGRNKGKQAGTGEGRRGEAAGGGLGQKVREGGSDRDKEVKVGDVDQYGVYLPLVYGTVWIRQRRREQEKKQGIGWEGGDHRQYFIQLLFE